MLEVAVLHQVKFVNRILLEIMRSVDGQRMVVTHGIALQNRQDIENISDTFLKIFTFYNLLFAGAAEKNQLNC